jgi:hypothetical protein
MSSDCDMVLIKTIDDLPLQSPKYYLLNLNKNLSDIRKELKKRNIINDTLLFSKKNKDVFGEIIRETEKQFLLEHIIDRVVNDDNSNNIILYLKKSSSPNWDILNNKCKLDYGCTMSFDGIKRANKKAFTMKNCELTYIGGKGYKKDQLEFESKEDWIKKTNLFINVDDNTINNFVKYGLSVGISQNENFNEEVKSVYKYTELEKVLLNFREHLEPTEDFVKAVKDAISSESPREEFKEIIEEYGQFIPTKVILGGRVYFKDVKKSLENSIDKSKEVSMSTKIGGNYSYTKRNSKFYSFNRVKLLGGRHPEDNEFDENAEKDWIESLKDYQNWECIEFNNPISIFQLLPYDLRKSSFMAIGKRILYSSTEQCDYHLCKPGIYRNFVLNNMPSRISRIIQKNKDADCDIFATVIDTEDSKNIFFNCQIFNCSESKGKPSIIIHGIQKDFHPRKYKLKVGWMVIGYDIDFSYILSDNNVKLIKQEYDSQNQHEFDSIKLQLEYDDLITRNIPFFGIPILSNLSSLNTSLTIGHNFCNTQLDIEEEEEREEREEKRGEEREIGSKFKIDAFSYCSKKNCYVKLPKFTFCTIIILNNPTSVIYELLPFEFRKFSILGNKPYIDLKGLFTPQSPNSLNPKCVSLYLPKDNNYNPIFLNQFSEQINIEYAECKCNKTCSICKNKTLKISANEDNAMCIVCSLR